MPQPAISEQTAEALARIYSDAEARMARELADALAGAQNVKAARIRSLQQMVRDEVAYLEESSRSWLTDQVPLVYDAGAVAAADAVGSSTGPFAQVHREAMQALADRSWSDILRATRFVTSDTRRTIAALAKDAAARTLLGEATASGAGRDLAAAIRERTGMLTVKYANGARHGIADLADTLARTTTALSYQEGTLVQGHADRIEWYEIFDGAGCGWIGHDDGDLANGTIRSEAEVRTAPLSHPRCARSASPRPDISNRTEAQLAETPLADREAAAVEERARAALANVSTPKGHFAAGRQPRTPRQPRASRV